VIDNLINTLESLNVGLIVDNGNIKINAPKGTLSAEIIEDIKSHKDELIKLLSSSKAIPSAEKKDCYTLTSSQRRLWTLSQFEDGNLAYNIFDAFTFSGKVEIDKLSLAFLKLIERHESLRTIFKEDENGELGQYIIPVKQYLGGLKFLDISNNSSDELLKNHSKKVKEHIFNLEEGPLFIGEVVKTSDQEHVLLLNMHHIIGDGWSMGVLSKEFVLIYNSLISGKGIALPELSIQYKDYAEWQNSSAKQLESEKSKSFWLDKFQGDLSVLELPTSKVRPKIKTYNGSNITYSFSKSTTSQFNTYAQQNEVTLFMLLMAGINGLFSRYTNTRDIILGTPVAGRQHTDLENQVGLYLNTLAIRTEFDESTSFEDLVAIEKTTLLDAYSHQEYPFDRLIDELPLKRDVSRSALFDVLIVFQNQQELFASNGMSINGVEISPYRDTQDLFSKFDISFIFSEAAGQLSLHLEYNTDVYKLDFIQRLCVHLDNFLTRGIHNPNQEVAILNYLEASEESLLFYDFNDTSFNIPDTSIVDLFVTQTAKTPESIAVIHKSKEFTYRELDEVSNELAHYLLDQYDLKTEDLVGVKLDRSEWLVISLLAVLKTGAAYVPIDPNYPEQRIDYIEEDSNCKVTIDEKILRSFRSTDAISNALPEISITPDTLAYVIYTSGSTGKPKGVMLTHKNASSMLHWSMREFNTIDFDILYAVTSHCFDLSVYEIFYPLSIGKPIRVLDNGLSIGDYLDTDTNVLINTVPSVIQSLLDKNVSFENVTGINLAGEAFPLRLAEHFQDSDIQVRNLYGPSEDTTYSSCQLINEVYTGSVPIGKPVDNTQFYILSEELALQPIGVEGEICISGACLSRGYLHRPELTAEKFVAHPFKEGEKLYKTGDLGKWQPDGTILFSGRKDSQVKVRGHRIELGEIAHVLEHQVDIDQAVVIVKELDGNQELVAYLVGELADKSALRTIVSNELPEYMIPNYFVVLDKLPLTPNGKIDKKALPAVESEDRIQRTYVAPVTKLEKQLVNIWEEVLGFENIGTTDDFFELGGHSLKVILILNKIKKELGLELSIKDMFLNPTVNGIIALVQKNGCTITIPKANEQDSYALTSSQRRLWTLSQFAERSVAYNIPGVYQLKGNVNVDVLSKAFRLLIARHESLRTCFRSNNDGETRQHILPLSAIQINIPVDDLSAITTENQDQKIASILDENNKRVFDLNQAPLITLRLIQLASDDQLLAFNMHHIISDGWSIEVMSAEFMVIYKALLKGVDHALPELPIQYKDYSEWITGEEQQSKLETAKEYWLDKFKGDLPVLKLPTTKARPKIKTYSGDSLTYRFSKNGTSELELFSKKKKKSLFVLLMAGINGLLSRYTNTRDIILGTPVAGRDHTDLENQIGLYLNTLAIRTSFESSTSFDDLLDIQNTTLLDAYSHQDYPFDSLVDQLGIQRDTSRSPLFDVMVVLQNQQNLLSSRSVIEGDLSIKPYTDNYRKSSQFDLSFNFSQTEGQLSLHLEYNTDIYEADFIENLVVHLEQFLLNSIGNPSQKVSVLSYLSASEEQELLYDFNATKRDHPEGDTIIDLFTVQVLNTPDAIAVVYEGKNLTYRYLDEVSNQLAHYLLHNYDLELEDLVGVKLDRSEWFVISILAILKTGAAYVPIDPNYPKDRISYIEEDSNCKVGIDFEFIDNFINKAEGYSKLPLTTKITSRELAYVIYTSGSTGKPKGVMLEHGGMINTINSQILEYKLTPLDHCLQFASSSFDASIWEIFISLLSGAKLYIIPDTLKGDIELFLQYINKNNITWATLPPALLKLLSVEKLKSIRVLITAGEEAPLEKAKAFSKIGRYVNAYGPTETSICASVFTGDITTKVPIGKPIDNTQIYILSEELALQPIGVEGEICISGAGLSRGYLNRPKLTAEKFVNHPFNEGEKLYKTGDLGRWLVDGTIEFIGRKDDQVKIRGHRIELGEIEQALLAQDEITQVLVMVQEFQGESILVSYLVTEMAINKSAIRNSLGKRLPDYMVPSHYVVLDAFPLTHNGKINKKGLPAVTNEDGIRREYVPPVTKLEKRLAGIWEEVLGIENIGITDNFFELGGHSLKGAVVVNKAKKFLGIELSIRDLFLSPTIRGVLSVSKSFSYESIPVTIAQDNYRLTSSQHRIWMLSQFVEASIAYNIPGVFKLTGSLDIAKLKEAFLNLIERHESLRTVFKRDDQEEVRQYILPIDAIVFDIDNYDVSEELTQTSIIPLIIEDNNHYQFNLEEGPLVKLGVIKVSSEEHLLLFTMHHIISDGWSMEVMSRELIQTYDSLVNNTAINLPILPIQYKDYSEWLCSKVQEEAQKQSRGYWLSQFNGELPVLELPTDKMRPKVKTYIGDCFTYHFSEELGENLQKFSKDRGVSLFMTLLSGINGLFSRYTGSTDIIIGTPIAGRDHSELEHQIGLYLNTLAIRTRFEATANFDDLIAIQKDTLLDAYSHQNYPLDLLVEELDLQRDTSRSALFDVMVVLQNQQDVFSSNVIETEGLKVTPYNDYNRHVSQFDLNFIFSEQGNDVSLLLEYNTDIYEEGFIQNLVVHLEQFLLSSIGNPSQKVSALSYLSASEEQELLYDFNATERVYPEDDTIIDLFTLQVKKTPDAIAVVYEDKELTYQYLDEVSNQLAHYLLHHYDLELEDLVGVKLDRSEWLIISILAILKAGAAYVPIDPNYPEHRIAYMEADSNCKVTLDEDLLRAFEKEECQISFLPEVDNRSTSLAYIMYTSGSTGNPKGVMVEHKSIIRLVKSSNFYQCSKSDILLSTGAFSFDATTFEYWGTLLNGSRLILCSKDTLLDNELLSKEIIKRKVNIMWFTAGWLHQLVDTSIDLFSPLSTILAGGNKLSPQHINILRTTYPELEIINGYGPTENTTFSLTYNIADVVGDIPIGYPISNSTAYILSDNLGIQPIGVIGEICVGGSGLSRGYLNQPELTAKKFVPHPFREGKKLYKTGDIGRWLADGTIEFIGRKDDQVKIRGFRIELGEIEQVLLDLADIGQAVVMVQEFQGTNVLVCYLVAEKDIDKSSLRSNLGEKLPDYMVPNYFVILDILPLTPNGKIDKKSLPKVEIKDLIQQDYIAPETELEERLVILWEEVLGVDKIGITDNFFELGGHSLKATRLIGNIHKTFQVRLDLKQLFSNPTLKEQARLIESCDKKTFSNIEKTEIADSYPLSDAQRRLLFLSQVEEDSIAYNMPSYMVLNDNCNIGNFKKAIKAVIHRHEILRTIFKEDGLGDFRQYILSKEELDFQIDIVDFSQEIDKDECVKIYVRDDSYAPFDLNNGPLIRVSLLKLSDNQYVFYYNMHHIISDGWSMEVLAKDVLAYYEYYRKGKVLELPELNIQYKDYAVWQQNQIRGDDFQNHKHYWLNQFSGEVPKLNMNIAKKRPLIKTNNGGIVRNKLSIETSTKLLDLAQNTSTTLYMNVLSVIYMLLYRYSYQKDIIIGSPLAGRENPELKNQIGFYLNTIALRQAINNKETYNDLLKNVKNTVLEGFKHQEYPFDSLVEDLAQDKDLSRSPLFDVFLVINEELSEKKQFTTVKKELKSSQELDVRSKFDITFYFIVSGKEVSYDLIYNKNLFDASVINKLSIDFVSLFEQIVQDSSNLIENYCDNILDTEEKDEHEQFTLALDSIITEDF